MKKQTTIELLKSQLPGFYSVEQVISLIEGIEEPKATPSISAETVVELVAKLERKVSQTINHINTEDAVDYSSAIFDINNGNELYLSEIYLNGDNIADEVNTAIHDVIHDFFSPEEENESED